jgi:hypothetical protein
MTKDINAYEVVCRTCRKKFSVQLFDSHEKNLFVAAKKDWYCDECKKAYFKKQTSALSKTHQDIGFAELEGTEKMISWAETIRAELINKVNYLNQSLTFSNAAEKQISDKAFEQLFNQWQAEKNAKWWIDNRKMTVRDISSQIAKFAEKIRQNHAHP